MNYERYGKWGYIASYSALNYFQAAGSLLLTVLLVHFLSVTTFAEYRLGVTVLSIVSVAGLYGAEKGLLIDLVHRKSEAVTTVGYWLVRLVVAMATATVVAVYVAFTGGFPGATCVAVLFGASGVLMALRSPGWFDYRVRLRQHAAILLSDRLMLVTLATIGLLLWGRRVDATVLGLMTLAAVAMSLVVEVVIIFGQISISRIDVREVAGEIKSVISRHVWIWLLALSNMLMTSLGQLALFSRGGLSEFAYLGLALQFATVARLFIQQVVRLRGASIAIETGLTQDRMRLARHMLRSVLIVIGGSVILAFAICGIGTYVLLNFFEGRYVPAIPVIWVLSAWTVILGVGLNVNRYVIGVGLQKSAFVTGLFWGLLSIVLVYLLAPTTGALGYAVILLGCHAGSILSQAAALFGRHSRVRRDVV